MVLYLGIDGGGTGCRAAVADASGHVLGLGAAGPANIASDPEGACENILAATRAALGSHGGLEGLRAVMGLAGANLPQFVQRLTRALPFPARVESDARIALAGALRDGDGIVASIGTGSVFAVQLGGAIRQIGGWGLVLGDEASGAWLGRALLARALHAVDGHHPMTPLLEAALAAQGGAEGVVAFARDARPVDFAVLAPQVAGSADPAALAVMERAEREVIRAVEALQPAGHTLPVVFLGGLGGAFAARLAGRWPVAEPQGNALDGALWLARREG